MNGKGTVSAPRERVDPDEAAVIADFIAFLKEASRRRYPAGPILRFNQGRDSGCVDAEFTVLPDLPGDLRVGLFAAPRTYRAWIRFANAASRSDREKDVRGMSIKVYDVPGVNLTPGATTQDLVLNSHPVMVASDTRSFLELMRAMDRGGLQQALYFLRHPRSARTGFAARSNPSSHLDIPYWSTTPYLYGPDRAVKYIARPCNPAPAKPPATLTDNYLGEALRTRLAAAEACFDFMVQFQSDDRRMPIEDAMVEWQESDSPYRAVARIRIPPQRLDDPARKRACEDTGFNPWHALPEHRPLGSMNRARREIYRAMAEFRQPRPASPGPNR
jgi:hypothetical protein